MAFPCGGLQDPHYSASLNCIWDSEQRQSMGYLWTFWSIVGPIATSPSICSLMQPDCFFHFYLQGAQNGKVVWLCQTIIIYMLCKTWWIIMIIPNINCFKANEIFLIAYVPKLSYLLYIVRQLYLAFISNLVSLKLFSRNLVSLKLFSRNLVSLKLFSQTYVIHLAIATCLSTGSTIIFYSSLAHPALV